MNDKELINQLIKNIVEPNNHNYINQYAKQPQNIHNIFTLKRIIEQRLSLNITDLDPNNLVDSQILAHYDYLKIVMFMKTRKEILEFNWAINVYISIISGKYCQQWIQFIALDHTIRTYIQGTQ